MAGGQAKPRAAAAPARPAAGAGSAQQQPSGGAAWQQPSFPGQGHSLAPQPTYDAEVQLLKEMGFDGAAARAALQASGGDVERAIGHLSDGAAGAGAAAQPQPLVDVSSSSSASSDPAAVSAVAAVAMAQATAADIPRLGEALAEVPSGGASLAILRKLVGNVRDAPSEAKFRKVRLTNPKIATALGKRVEAFALLAACGFRLDASREHAEMADADAADAPALEWACVSLDAAVAMHANGGPPVPAGPCDVKVLVAAQGQPMRFDEVGDDFYALTPAEVKAIMDGNAARRAKEERLMTQQQREAEKLKQRRLYRKAMIRVRFPDDVVLQATFAATAPVATLLSWVESALREPGHSFELAIARGQPLSELAYTLEQAELAPAAMLNFRPTQPGGGGMSPPYLNAAHMASVQVMGEEAIPQGIGGGPAGSGPMGAVDTGGGSARPRNDNANRAPGWMRQQ